MFKSSTAVVRYTLVSLILGLPIAAQAVKVGDFELDSDQASIPIDEIHSGGPPKDGIPAIDEPQFISADKGDAPADNIPVLGLYMNGIAKAYPIDIMNWHEIVNDQFAGDPVVVTYCPLCGSGVAFSAEVQGERLQFGVSGLLYNSDVLLYDRKTESLWSQLLAKAVTGEMNGTPLKILPLMVTTWGEWRSLYPKTRVLSRDTGFFRDYDRDPYAGYENSFGVYFPVKHRDPRFHPKELVYGVEIGGRFKAYPVAELSQVGGEIRDVFADSQLKIDFNPQTRSARFYDQQGREVPVIRTYWFAWYAFHPDTAVFTP